MDLFDFNNKAVGVNTLSTAPIITDKLSLFLQELEIMFGTHKGEVLGDNTRGNEIEDALWKSNISSYSLKSLVNRMINDGCFMNEYFIYNVEFDLMKGQLRDIGYLTIEIQTEDNKTERVTFKYS